MCHASEDRLVAESAVVALEARGFECWIAPRDVPPGTDYANAILAGISGSRLLLLVFSDRANRSPHVPREVERAVHRGMPIIPFRLDDVEPGGPLEYFISGSQWLDATAGRPEDHLPALVGAVSDLLRPDGSASGAKDFSAEARTVLEDVVFRYGTDVSRDSRRLQAVLRDMAGEYRAEVSALVIAAEEGVPDSLLQTSDVRATMGRLAQRLQDYRALGEAAAWWAVESWASALRLTVAPAKPDTVQLDDAVETVPAVEESSSPPVPSSDIGDGGADSTPTNAGSPPAADDEELDQHPLPTAPDAVSDAPPSGESRPVAEPPPAADVTEPAVPAEAVSPAPVAEPPDSQATPQDDPEAAPADTPVAAAVAGNGREDRPRRRWLVALGLAAMAVIGVLAVVFLLGGGDDEPTAGTSATTTTTSGPTSTATTEPDSGDGGLGGTSVTVYGNLLAESEIVAITDVLAAFGRQSGIGVEYVAISNLGVEIFPLVARGEGPDIALLPQPGVVAELARDGALAVLPDAVSGVVAEQWPPTWMAFGEVDGNRFGIPTQSDVKSLVWFKPGRFEALGYPVPQSWDELRALTDRAIADGNTPWCVGVESGDATGWVFTDWVEDLTLRFFGPDFYDQWVAHEVPFTSPEVAAVWSEVLDLWGTPGAVHGGRGSITSTWVFDGAQLLLDDLCLMHRQGSFLGASFPPGSDEIDVFYLPSAHEDRPVLVSGNLAAAFRDAPEVWAVMEYLGSAEYATQRQEAQSRLAGGGPSSFLTANTAVDQGVFSPLEQSALEILRSGEPVRFDGSDEMPAAVGTGTFWSQGTRAIDAEITVEEALEIIESSWP